MSEWSKELFGFLALVFSAGILALLVGHAAATGSLIQAGTQGVNTLLNTVELTNTASNTQYMSPSNVSNFGSIDTGSGFGIPALPGIGIGNMGS